jgi:PGF-pre-PGF domain-containing protein
MKKALAILAVIMLVSSMTALGELIPSTSPCWVKGTLTLDGSSANAEATTLSIFVDGSQQKSATLDATGVFSFNSIQGVSGSTVIMKLCGLYNSSSPAMQFAFQPYCTTSDTEPWIVKNVAVNSFADGTIGCTCADVCSGGYCINAGTAGACSSTNYYCDNDNSCESAYGENLDNCDDCSSGGSGGGSSGGGGGIAALQTTSSQNIAGGSTGNFVITNSNLLVTGIAIDVVDAVTGAKVTVMVTFKPAGAPAPIDSALGSTYKYLSITSTVPSSGIESAKISFSVPMSWFSSNGFDQASTQLMRWANGAWQPLSTKLLGSSNGNYNFEAVSPGFSTFAVVASNGSGVMQLLDIIREFYAGTSSYTALQILDKIRAFYGGQ